MGCREQDRGFRGSQRWGGRFLMVAAMPCCQEDSHSCSGDLGKPVTITTPFLYPRKGFDDVCGCFLSRARAPRRRTYLWPQVSSTGSPGVILMPAANGPPAGARLSFLASRPLGMFVRVGRVFPTDPTEPPTTTAVGLGWGGGPLSADPLWSGMSHWPDGQHLCPWPYLRLHRRAEAGTVPLAR